MEKPPASGDADARQDHAMTAANSTFFVASNESRVGTVRYVGHVIVSPNEIYIFQNRFARGRKYLELIELLADHILPTRRLAGATYTAIPESIRSHPEWPVRNAISCPVLVIPRTAIDFLHHKKGKLEVRLVFSGTDIAIYHGRFGGRRIRSFIEETSWPALWDNQLINAQETLAMRQKANESAKRLRTPNLSYSIIGGGFLIGIIPIYLLNLRTFGYGPLSNLILVFWIISVLLILFGWIALRRGF